MQESVDSTRLGANRTGLQMSPHHAKEMRDNIDAVPADASAAEALADMRLQYVAEADPLGSIPAPATLQGMAKSGAKMLTGNRPQVLVDKLAERLAFERGGTRLYDAVLVKFQAHSDELPDVRLQDVQQLRDEEAQHALMLQECIENLGADPTAQTPSAALVGMESMGLMQTVSDPRTTLVQTLHATLAAELIDAAGWETLIALAENMGQDEMAERFRGALRQEGEHEAKIKDWYNALTLETGELLGGPVKGTA